MLRIVLLELALEKFMMCFTRQGFTIVETADYEEFPTDYKLKDSDFYFYSQVLNKDFDNDNNPYMKMKLYIYHNLNGYDETTRVPLVECQNKFLPQSVIDMDYYGKFYCPDFSDND